MDTTAKTFTISTADPADTATYAITVTMAISAIPAGTMAETFTFNIDVQCVVSTLTWSPAIPSTYTHELLVDPVPVTFPFVIIQDPLCSAALTFTLTKPASEAWISNQADSSIDLTANSLSLLTDDHSFSLQVNEPISGLVETSNLVVSLINHCEIGALRAETFPTHILYAWQAQSSHTIVPFTLFSVDAETLYGLDCGHMVYTTSVITMTPPYPDSVSKLLVNAHSQGVEMVFDESKISLAGLVLNLELTGSLADYPV